MLQYIIKRLLSTIPVLLGISLLLFFMLRMLPGDRPRCWRARWRLRKRWRTFETSWA